MHVAFHPQVVSMATPVNIRTPLNIETCNFVKRKNRAVMSPEVRLKIRSLHTLRSYFQFIPRKRNKIVNSTFGENMISFLLSGLSTLGSGDEYFRDYFLIRIKRTSHWLNANFIQNLKRIIRIIRDQMGIDLHNFLTQSSSKSCCSL